VLGRRKQSTSVLQERSNETQTYGGADDVGCRMGGMLLEIVSCNGKGTLILPFTVISQPETKRNNVLQMLCASVQPSFWLYQVDSMRNMAATLPNMSMH
jgi:hypothetical protein